MGKNVPKLRFRGFEGEWEEKKLGDIADKITEKNKNFRITNVISNSAKDGLINQRNFFDKDIANKNNIDGYYVIKKDSFVYNPRKSNEAPYGPINKFNHEEEGVVSPLYFCFNSKDNTNCDYLESYFKSSKWYRYIYMNSDQGARHDRVSIKDSEFMNMKILIASLQEQEKIANLLSKVDRYIELQEKKVSELEKYKKGMMQKIFSQKIRFSIDESKKYPEWQQDSLDNLTTYVDYRGKTPLKTDEGIFLVTAKNIKNGYIDYKASKEFISEDSYNSVMRRGTVKIGDVLLTTEAPLGNVAQVDRENIALAQRVIKFRGKSQINNSYLKYYFLSENFQNMLNKKSIGTTVQGIQGKVLHKMKIEFPSIQEQKKIAHFLSKVDLLIEKQNQKLEELKMWKKGLLQKMFV